MGCSPSQYRESLEATLPKEVSVDKNSGKQLKTQPSTRIKNALAQRESEYKYAGGNQNFRRPP